MSDQLVLGIKSTDDKSDEEHPYTEIILWFPEDLFLAKYRPAHENLMRELGEIGSKNPFTFRVSDRDEHLFEYRARVEGPRATHHTRIIEHITDIIEKYYTMQVKFVGCSSEELKLISVPLLIPAL